MCYQRWLLHKMSWRTSCMFLDDTAANAGISIGPNSTTRSEDHFNHPQKYSQLKRKPTHTSVCVHVLTNVLTNFQSFLIKIRAYISNTRWKVCLKSMKYLCLRWNYHFAPPLLISGPLFSIYASVDSSEGPIILVIILQMLPFRALAYGENNHYFLH